MQEITLIGRLGKDASVRESTTGNKFFSLAVAVDGRNKGVTVTQWYDVICFDVSRYEKMLPYLTKGSSIVVIGELYADVETYVDANNKERARCRRTVTADLIKFGPKSGNSGMTTNEATTITRPSTPVADAITARKAAGTPKKTTFEPMDIPMGAIPTVAETAPSQPVSEVQPMTTDSEVADDLPF